MENGEKNQCRSKCISCSKFSKDTDFLKLCFISWFLVPVGRCGVTESDTTVLIANFKQKHSPFPSSPRPLHLMHFITQCLKVSTHRFVSQTTLDAKVTSDANSEMKENTDNLMPCCDGEFPESTRLGRDSTQHRQAVRPSRGCFCEGASGRINPEGRGWPLSTAHGLARCGWASPSQVKACTQQNPGRAWSLQPHDPPTATGDLGFWTRPSP